MISKCFLTSLLALALAAPALADDPPLVEHQPVPCTVPDQPMSLCAAISDDAMVNFGRVYFRQRGERYYSYAEMAFTGLQYCATLPAPRAGKLDAIEYYVQAVDDAFQTQRTSTFQMTVQSPEVCGFPPLERDPEKAASITVHATHQKQGDKLDGDFVREGVNFVRKN
jgi:hypothetical protein